MAKNDEPVTTTTPVLEEILEEHGLELGADKYLYWHAGSHHHPRNWHWRRKYYDVGLIMFLEMFMSAMSTVGTAVSNQARSEYGFEKNKTLGYFAFTSAYLLGEGVGGIFFPPVSESFGRKSIYAAAALLNCVFCILVAAVPPSVSGSLAVVVVARGAAGIVGSVPATVAPGSLEDMYGPKERIWAIAAWTTASNVGVLVGPIYGSYVSAYLGWRWVFWISSYVMGISFIFCLFLRESRPTLLLQQKLTTILALTNNTTPLRVRNPDAVPSPHAFLTETLIRPLRLLTTEPIVILCSTLNALTFALIYGLTEGLTVVYSSPSYGLPLPQTTSSLAFLPLTLGLFLSLPLRALDARRFAADPTPERKLRSLALSAPALACGLWAFAWTVPPRAAGVPAAASLAALAPVGLAVNDVDAALAGYVADAYAGYAASAFAALSLLRALAAAAFPLFAGAAFERLGANVAGSALAAAATALCACPNTTDP
ncbi:mfs multidrug transporter [Neofusicoccum parvum]|uniref:Mfs multidrug transporter n=1 Tax=Neofusicoccum parvum TaxID=310453 RepID=A0ACB5SGM6_9PEZI|nr:mfs multidrug transporter [Neofusicoccum parvum]